MNIKAKISQISKKQILLFAIICSFNMLISAQQKQPKSIYTFSSTPLKNSTYVLNKKLKLNNFDFVYVDLLDVDLNQFSIDFQNIGKKPSSLIYDDYNAYRDENFLKGFRLENDPTRWNLQFPNPLSVQPTLAEN